MEEATRMRTSAVPDDFCGQNGGFSPRSLLSLGLERPRSRVTSIGALGISCGDMKTRLRNLDVRAERIIILDAVGN